MIAIAVFNDHDIDRGEFIERSEEFLGAQRVTGSEEDCVVAIDHVASNRFVGGCQHVRREVWSGEFDPVDVGEYFVHRVSQKRNWLSCTFRVSDSEIRGSNETSLPSIKNTLVVNYG